MVDQSIEIVRRRIDETGTNEPSIQSQGADRIAVQLPGEQNPNGLKPCSAKPPSCHFNLVDSRTSAADARRGKLSNTSRLINSAEGETLVIGRR